MGVWISVNLVRNRITTAAKTSKRPKILERLDARASKRRPTIWAAFRRRD